MADYLLDTSFLIDLLNGEERASRIHEDTRGRQVTSTVCLYELSKFEGFDPGIFRARDVCEYTLDDARRAGEVYRRLKGRGEPVGETDTMISAVAMNRGLTLITRDDDFGKVRGLDVRLY